MRDFVPRLEQDMLTDRFRHHETQRLVGDLVLGKIARAFRQGFQNALQQFVESLLLQGGDGNDLLEIEQGLELGDQRQQVALVGEQIDLVEQQKNRSTGAFDQIENDNVFGGPFALGVHDEEDELAALESFVNVGHHLAAE